MPTSTNTKTDAIQRMIELGTRHALLEGRCDLEGVMATLSDDPVYEFYPLRQRMRGRETVRRYYEHLMAEFIPRASSVLVQAWGNETSVAQEYDITITVDGAEERHRVLGILVGDGQLLTGERVYGSERAIRLMLGPIYELLEPIA